MLREGTEPSSDIRSLSTSQEGAPLRSPGLRRRRVTSPGRPPPHSPSPPCGWATRTDASVQPVLLQVLLESFSQERTARTPSLPPVFVGGAPPSSLPGTGSRGVAFPGSSPARLPCSSQAPVLGDASFLGQSSSSCCPIFPEPFPPQAPQLKQSWPRDLACSLSR